MSRRPSLTAVVVVAVMFASASVSPSAWAGLSVPSALTGVRPSEARVSLLPVVRARSGEAIELVYELRNDTEQPFAYAIDDTGAVAKAAPRLESLPAGTLCAFDPESQDPRVKAGETIRILQPGESAQLLVSPTLIYGTLEPGRYVFHFGLTDVSDEVGIASGVPTEPMALLVILPAEGEEESQPPRETPNEPSPVGTGEAFASRG